MSEESSTQQESPNVDFLSIEKAMLAKAGVQVELPAIPAESTELYGKTIKRHLRGLQKTIRKAKTVGLPRKPRTAEQIKSTAKMRAALAEKLSARAKKAAKSETSGTSGNNKLKATNGVTFV